MKCEICNEEIVEGKGRYLTPIGAVCIKCNNASPMRVQVADTRAQSQKNTGASEYGPGSGDGRGRKRSMIDKHVKIGERGFNMSDHIDKNSVKEKIMLELTDHSLSNAEATLINEVLQETGWNLKRAARRLKIARGTLYSKMKKYDIKRPAMPAIP